MIIESREGGYRATRYARNVPNYCMMNVLISLTCSRLEPFSVSSGVLNVLIHNLVSHSNPLAATPATYHLNTCL